MLHLPRWPSPQLAISVWLRWDSSKLCRQADLHHVIAVPTDVVRANPGLSLGGVSRGDKTTSHRGKSWDCRRLSYLVRTYTRSQGPDWSWKNKGLRAPENKGPEKRGRSHTWMLTPLCHFQDSCFAAGRQGRAAPSLGGPVFRGFSLSLCALFFPDSLKSNFQMFSFEMCSFKSTSSHLVKLRALLGSPRLRLVV